MSGAYSLRWTWSTPVGVHFVSEGLNAQAQSTDTRANFQYGSSPLNQASSVGFYGNGETGLQPRAQAQSTDRRNNFQYGSGASSNRASSVGFAGNGERMQ